MCTSILAGWASINVNRWRSVGLNWSWRRLIREDIMTRKGSRCCLIRVGFNSCSFAFGAVLRPRVHGLHTRAPAWQLVVATGQWPPVEVLEHLVNSEPPVEMKPLVLDLTARRIVLLTTRNSSREVFLVAHEVERPWTDSGHEQ